MTDRIKSNGEILLYQTQDGQTRMDVRLVEETVWLTQAQMAELFQKDVRTISEHIGNVFTEGELEPNSTVRNFRIVQKEGKREVDRDIKHYNLDMILSVGYRVNSKKATLFRQWATKTLREHITQGFTINRSRIKTNYEAFLAVAKDIQKLLPATSAVNPSDAIELISLFADTWLSLDAYDRGTLAKGKLTKKKAVLTAEKITKSLVELKVELINKNEATDIFGMERSSGSVAGIIGNVMQSFAGNEVYPTVEEKAAHLLYFMVKNHPFTDGNKRSGAYAFVWFLKQAKLLDLSKLTPSALTALTVLVAESDAIHKDKTIKLILNLISKK